MTKNDAIKTANVPALINTLRGELLKNRGVIPLNLREFKAWLCYRVTKIDSFTGKFNKIPVYPRTGRNRSGEQGGYEDLNNLGTYDEAITALDSDGSLAGIGFATLATFGVVALDVDHCVKDGEVRSEVFNLVRETYAEFSPSGTGIRAFWLGQAINGKNHIDGFELFHSTGFVTVTGDQIEDTIYELIGSDEISEISIDLRLKLESESRSSNNNKNERKGNADHMKEQGSIDPIMLAIKSAGLYERNIGSGKHSITCPWESEHSDPDRAQGDADTVYMQPHTNGHERGNFHCSHAHCDSRTNRDFELAIGLDHVVNDFEMIEMPPDGDIGKLFDDVILKDEHVQKMADAEFLYPNMIVRGHIGAYVAPANGGKTAVFLHLSEKLSAMGLKVLYINVDGSPGDLKRHHQHAKLHGYSVIAPDACDGKSVADVIKKFHAIANSNERCDEYVFIVDTLKKFVDVIDKRQAKGFYNLARSLSVRGATVCFLGHCNKYKDDEGRPIYEGTADLRNDLDELIYLDSSMNDTMNRLEITTRPDKVRAEFEPISFYIDFDNERKVTQAENVIKIMSKEERELVELITEAIVAGNHSQKEIVSSVKEKTTLSDKRIREKLIAYSAGDKPVFAVKATGRGKDLHYSIRDSCADFEEASLI